MASDVKSSSDPLPEEGTIGEISDLEVQDAEGVKKPFRSLYDPDGETASKKQLIIFIRHFYCGHCEDYVRALSSDKALKSSSTVAVTIIGCGQPSVISDYYKRTNCAYPIYSDPHRRIYAALKLVENLDLGDKKPGYIKSGLVGGTLSSAWNMFSSGKKGLQGGAYNQNGGEFVFEGGEVKWCHRMKNTRDHAEVEELKEVLGL